MTETDIRNSIVLALSREGHAVFRANVGQFFTQDGRPIRTGLPVGFSDLFGFRKDDARAFFIEVKRPGCKPTSGHRCIARARWNLRRCHGLKDHGASGLMVVVKRCYDCVNLPLTPNQSPFGSVAITHCQS